MAQRPGTAAAATPPSPAAPSELLPPHGHDQQQQQSVQQSVQQLKAAGDAAFRAAQHAAAVQHYSAAIARCEQLRQPDLLLPLLSNRAAARLALQHWQDALADAQASVAVDEGWVKGWFRSAKALQGLGKLELAVHSATKALQLEPGNRQVQQLLVQLKQQQQPQQPQQQLPLLTWQQRNQLRSSLDLQQLPRQLVAGSRYVPSPDGSNANLLLLFHGLGDRPANFAAFGEKLQLPQTAILALSGPGVVPETDGGRQWHEAFEPDSGELIQPRAGETRRTASLAATLQLLQRLLFEALPAAGGWRPGEVQLCGFSQGGTVALELGRRCRDGWRLGGCVAVSAALLEEDLMSQQQQQPQHAAGSGTDVLITHGGADQVSRALVTRSVAALKAAGCAVQLTTLPGKGHGLIASDTEARACMQFWAQRLKQRPPTDDPDLVEL